MFCQSMLINSIACAEIIEVVTGLSHVLDFFLFDLISNVALPIVQVVAIDMLFCPLMRLSRE